jgi:hypothetical protein
MYQATIYFDSNEDSYTEGELPNGGANWSETLTADTKEELKEQICEATYSKWEDIEQEDINEYPDATEYWASYLSNDNEGEATKWEVEAWKQGKLRLWAVSCHILVSEVTKRKAVL